MNTGDVMGTGGSIVSFRKEVLSSVAKRCETDATARPEVSCAPEEIPVLPEKYGTHCRKYPSAAVQSGSSCEKWVTDITEFRAGGQKLYLSPILDLFNGEIVAWETACRPTEELVKRMLNKGLESLAEGEKPLLHSDQGWHYRIKVISPPRRTEG